ncbi:MAG: hypothetical protein ACJAU4_001211 [Glaciecola sp.]|mgnify:CR=1 FL=1|jgi:hypothetical protein
MGNIIGILFLLAFSGKALANESIIIFVKETGYLVDTAEVELNSVELENKLKQLKFSLVTLDVDYCAPPDMLASAYIAIANANPEVKSVNLKLSGDHEKSKCQNA